jgi:hypothetical protein
MRQSWRRRRRRRRRGEEEVAVIVALSLQKHRLLRIFVHILQ